MISKKSSLGSKTSKDSYLSTKSNETTYIKFLDQQDSLHASLTSYYQYISLLKRTDNFNVEYYLNESEDGFLHKLFFRNRTLNKQKNSNKESFMFQYNYLFRFSLIGSARCLTRVKSKSDSQDSKMEYFCLEVVTPVKYQNDFRNMMRMSKSPLYRPQIQRQERQEKETVTQDCVVQKVLFRKDFYMKNLKFFNELMKISKSINQTKFNRLLSFGKLRLGVLNDQLVFFSTSTLCQCQSIDGCHCPSWRQPVEFGIFQIKTRHYNQFYSSLQKSLKFYYSFAELDDGDNDNEDNGQNLQNADNLLEPDYDQQRQRQRQKQKQQQQSQQESSKDQRRQQYEDEQSRSSFQNQNYQKQKQKSNDNYEEETYSESLNNEPQQQQSAYYSYSHKKSKTKGSQKQKQKDQQQQHKQHKQRQQHKQHKQQKQNQKQQTYYQQGNSNHQISKGFWSKDIFDYINGRKQISFTGIIRNYKIIKKEWQKVEVDSKIDNIINRRNSNKSEEDYQQQQQLQLQRQGSKQDNEDTQAQAQGQAQNTASNSKNNSKNNNNNNNKQSKKNVVIDMDMDYFAETSKLKIHNHFNQIKSKNKSKNNNNNNQDNNGKLSKQKAEEVNQRQKNINTNINISINSKYNNNSNNNNNNNNKNKNTKKKTNQMKQIIIEIMQDTPRHTKMIGVANISVKYWQADQKLLLKQLQIGKVCLFLNLTLRISNNLQFYFKFQYKANLIHILSFDKICLPLLNKEVIHNLDIIQLRNLMKPILLRNIIKIDVTYVECQFMFGKIICGNCSKILIKQDYCSDCEDVEGQIILWAQVLVADETSHARLSLQNANIMQFFEFTPEELEQIKKMILFSVEFKSCQSVKLFSQFLVKYDQNPKEMKKFQRKMKFDFYSKKILAIPKFDEYTTFKGFPQQQKHQFLTSFYTRHQFISQKKIFFNGFSKIIDNRSQTVQFLKVIQVLQEKQ